MAPGEAPEASPEAKLPAKKRQNCLYRAMLLTHPLAPQEDLLELDPDGQVHSLGGEVPDHIGKLAFQEESKKALLLGDSHNTISDASVVFFCTDLVAPMLDLQQQFVPPQDTEAAIPPSQKS